MDSDLDDIKARGVEDIFIISMDGVSGLEEGAHSIFSDVIVQSCMVYLICNSIKYVSSKDYTAFTQALKKVYSAPCLSSFGPLNNNGLPILEPLMYGLGILVT